MPTVSACGRNEPGWPFSDIWPDRMSKNQVMSAAVTMKATRVPKAAPITPKWHIKIKM